ncbi:MAG: adenylate/guanylate cyclase domain-containing protein [bacterium]|nr:adenylate/guanylate cyclase domain-containing protein [bacterium]
MKMHPQLKMDITRILVITFIYILINWFFTFFTFALIYSEYSLGASGLAGDLISNLLSNTVIGVLAGILGGSALVIINGRYFRKKSFKFAMLFTFLTYVLSFITITLTISAINHPSASDYFNYDITYWEFYKENVFNLVSLTYFVLWMVITLITLFALQVNDKFGPGMLGKFLRGQYYQPKEEERIFMFLDMKSSTTIAEKLGNKRYFNLLNDIFTDITPDIIASEGEIYQYVGDEIVITWTMKFGLRSANCFTCFNRIQKRIDKLATYYEGKYGIAPKFKAGLHYGTVTSGEIGSIKKDIVYSGDVLNTASRIQEQCNQYGVNLLASKETIELVQNEEIFEFEHLGNIELRGKNDKLDLNSIRFLN